MDQKKIMRVHATITGIVQGVAFRYYTQRQATKLGLEGWVRNLPGGSVELEAQGPRQKLESLLSWCEQGPPSASVDEVLAQWKDASEEFHGFVIRQY